MPAAGRPSLPSASPEADDGEERGAAEFELLEEIGRGAMGIVYKARQPELDRVIAVKMLLAGQFATDKQISRLRREARAIARINHPGIVRIHGVRSRGSRPCLLMEFVEGVSLARRLRAGGLCALDAAAICQSMAEAIEVAHQSGVIHRDLKPANVLIDSKGVPKIVDFGLGKRLDEKDDLSEPGQVVGTANYIAPELADGNPDAIGPLLDVYSLGAVLYEMLIGRPPFEGSSITDTLMKVVRTDPVPVRQLKPSVDRDLETICMKCLRKEPRERYASALALANDLGRYRAQEPIAARPVGLLERGLKWARRRPSLPALAFFSALSFVLMAAGLSSREARLRSDAALHASELETAPAGDLLRTIDRLRGSSA